MALEKIASNICFGGQQLRYSHPSSTLNCEMNFSIFLPSIASTQKVPVLYWLSGLTCTDENFVHKAGAQKYAEQHGLAIVTPDTSPRGEGVPDDLEGQYDFGLGAGFYVNATQTPWAKHYQMYDYIIQELPELLAEHFPINREKSSIFGHSMGGHGALTIGLKNSEQYQSISAFAPIVSPMRCPWGKKALGNYLGENQEAWREYDATELIGKTKRQIPILIDQGNSDQFLVEQLQPELFTVAGSAVNYPFTLRMQEGYDHSYFFIASFMEDHIKFHAESLSI